MNDDILNKDLSSEPVTIETKKPILDKLGRAYATGRRNFRFKSMDKIR